ncbi:Putative monooxygenase MoxC [Achromobacter insuavis]|uniref:NtaA/DmoA family FMN-dependent monooxygenase n=1 Tax=Achromobacter insuavis TaxID=1287735 RepID=UPI0014660D27|nr:NtaA/DmoA family FMN-dependent monooxygenase [Achromobacter insuavis]CAB3893017.1 Putative monooxygenase MoxC [Achromobacter insuavis]
MTSRSDRLILVAFADPNAFYQSAPEQQKAPGRFQLQNFIEHARLAEQSGMDAIFKPDFLGFNLQTQAIHPRAGFEPLTLLTALSQHTRRLGLIATESTSFSEPYNIARFFTSLDHISQGRGAWNVVTSYNGEANYGNGTLPSLTERYARADEFMEVVYRLWSGWGEGAVRHDAQGHHVDTRRITPTRHKGRYYQVEEALDLAPGPQGRPVIVQAGASEQGLDFAARHAEIVFTATPDLEAGQRFYRDLKQRVAATGRDAASLKILPGLNLFIGASQAEARDLHRAQFTDDNLLAYRKKLVREAPLFRIDTLELDEQIPASAVPTIEALSAVERRRSRGLLLHKYLARPGQTLRGFLSDVFEFGHLTLIGTAESIADDMANWFTRHGSDGFVLKGGNSFARIAQDVAPLLREKGVLRPAADNGQSFRDALFA